MNPSTPEEVQAEQAARFAQALVDAIAAVPGLTTERELMRVANKVDQGIRPAEFNFPAAIITAVQLPFREGTLGRSLGMIAAEAEKSMMQIAFFNAGVNPPCSFIEVIYQAGWRFRIEKGFHKV